MREGTPNPGVCLLQAEFALREQLRAWIELAGFPVWMTASDHDALEQIRSGRCRVLLADLDLPQMNALAFLEAALRSDLRAQVIFIAGRYDTETAVRVVKAGASDFIAKPVERARLDKVLREIRAEIERQRRIQELEEELLATLELHGMVGRSPAFLEMLELVQRVAPHFSSVLLTGPAGAGKERVARALHQMSVASQHRFVVFACAGAPQAQLEAELFGQLRGFGGATDSRPGLIEFAAGGCLFLDEIGALSPSAQQHLLRVIQNRETQRLGSAEVRPVELRLIAATCRQLRADVQARRFSEDLFQEISKVEIHVPGLAERPEDIPLLIQHFLKKSNRTYGKNVQGVSRRALIILAQHSWPGNLRELEEVISAATLTAAGDLIDVRDFGPTLREPSSLAPLPETEWEPVPLSEVRRRHIQRVLEMCGGNRVRASEILGIGRTSLYRFLKRQGRRKVTPTAA